MSFRASLLIAFAAGCQPALQEPSGGGEPFAPLPMPDLKSAKPDPAEPRIYYRDADGDGYTGLERIESIDDPDGAGIEWVLTETAIDCDDDPNACGAGCHPQYSGPDLCDDFDQDCDGSLDEDPDRVWFVDRDGDGAGDPLSTTTSCDPLEGLVENGHDCDDDPDSCGAACAPGFFEGLEAANCGDGLDNDCDGAVDGDALACGGTNRPPVARFVINAGAASLGQPISFDASATRDPEDVIESLSFSWDFDSDGTSEISGRVGEPIASWTFAEAGVHTVTLRVTDPRGLDGELVGHAVVSAPDQLVVVDSADDTIADDGVTTLREAITQANTREGPDTITFAAPMTISLATGSLPLVTGADTTIAGLPGVAILGTPAALDFCLKANTDRTTILWLEVSGCTDDAIELQGTGNWIAHAYSHDNGDDGVDTAGTSNRVGPDVVVTNNGDAGFEVEGDLAIIEESRATGNGRGVELLQGNPAHRALLLRNTIASNGTGVVIAPGVDETKLWQNTIYGNQGDGVRYNATADGTPSGALHELRNNVLARNTGWAIATSGGFAALSSNAFFENGAGRCNGCQSDPPAIEGDPALIDPTSGDFRLSPDSPCIDAGEDLGLPFAGSAPDLGAFEHEP